MEVSDNVNQILQYPYRKRRPPMVQILDLFVESSEILFYYYYCHFLPGCILEGSTEEILTGELQKNSTEDATQLP